MLLHTIIPPSPNFELLFHFITNTTNSRNTKWWCLHLSMCFDNRHLIWLFGHQSMCGNRPKLISNLRCIRNSFCRFHTAASVAICATECWYGMTKTQNQELKIKRKTKRKRVLWQPWLVYCAMCAATHTRTTNFGKFMWCDTDEERQWAANEHQTSGTF